MKNAEVARIPEGQPLPGLTKEYFMFCAWWPPEKIRESVMSTSLFSNHDTFGEGLELAKRLVIDETERRKALPQEFCQCPRCRGYHWGLTNIDQLCEDCEVMTAPYRYAVNKLGMEPVAAWQHCLATWPLNRCREI